MQLLPQPPYLQVHHTFPDQYAPNLIPTFLFSCCWISMPTSTSKTRKMKATPPCTWQSCTRTSTSSSCCWTGARGPVLDAEDVSAPWSALNALTSPLSLNRKGPPGCRGADLSIRNNENVTAATMAAEKGDEELADLLSQRQALKRLQSTNTSRPRRLDSCLSSRNSQRPVEEGKT